METDLHAAASRLLNDPLWKGTYDGPEQEQGGHRNWRPIVNGILVDAQALAAFALPLLDEMPSAEAFAAASRLERRLAGENPEDVWESCNFVPRVMRDWEAVTPFALKVLQALKGSP